jgi:hypothetical protein
MSGPANVAFGREGESIAIAREREPRRTLCSPPGETGGVDGFSRVATAGDFGTDGETCISLSGAVRRNKTPPATMMTAVAPAAAIHARAGRLAGVGDTLIAAAR